MKLRTSFSEWTLCRKNIFRFAPIWGFYTVLCAMVLLMAGGNIYYYDEYACSIVSNWLQGFAVVNMLYAGVTALGLYGDLYQNKMCFAMHAMPQRRETRFLGYVLTGLAFSLVPNLLLALLMMLSLQSYWFLGLYWLLGVTLQYIFFFGAASLAAMLTGRRFAQASIYAMLNFSVLLVLFAVVLIYLPMTEGVVLNTEGFFRLTPVVQLVRPEYFLFRRVSVASTLRSSTGVTRHYCYEYLGLGQGWGYMVILAAVGLALLALALVLYRRRHLECAGDFLAFSKTKAPVCLVMTLIVGLIFALLGSLISDSYLPELLVGMTVGFFGSLMLLERRVKVFRKGTWLGYALVMILTVVSVIGVQQDWLGVERWVPEAEQVESVTVSNDRRSTSFYSYNDYYYSNPISVTITDPEEIERVLQAHQNIVDRLGIQPANTHQVTLTYRLSSGRTVIRSYSAPADGINYEIIRDILYAPEQLMGKGDMDWEEYVASVEEIYVAYEPLPPGLYPALLEALYADCRAGNVAVDVRDGKFYIPVELYQRQGSGGRSLYLYVSETATRTQELLKSPEYILGYSDWEAFVAATVRVNVGGRDLDSALFPELLGVLQKDILASNVTGNLDYTDTFITIQIEYRMDGILYCRYIYCDKHAPETLAWLREHNLYFGE